MNGLIVLIAALAILKRINAEPNGRLSLYLWIIVGLGLFLIAVGGALMRAW